MSSSTTNLGLVKPAYNEAADVAVINGNMDTIDTAIGTLINKTVTPQQYTSCADMFSSAPDNSFITGYTAVGAADNPTSTGNWVVLQRKVSSTYGFQFAMQSNTNSIFFRRLHGGTWYSWYSVANGYKSLTITPETGYTFTDNGSQVSETFLKFNGYFGKINTAITSPTKVASIPSTEAPSIALEIVVPISNGSTPTGFAYLTIQTNGDIKVNYMTGIGNIIFRQVLAKG